MNITKYETAIVEGATWEQVASALGGGHTNVPSCSYEQFEKACDAVDGFGGVVAMATHSIGGRWWAPAPGASVEDFPFWGDMPDPGDGWYILNGVDLVEVVLTSATSGSSVKAEHHWGDHTVGWTVTLTVPIEEDGTPYRGAYAAAFYAAFDA